MHFLVEKILSGEKKYEFRKRLLNIHTENIRDYTAAPTAQEMEIINGFTVIVPKNCPQVILTAARDFVDYLFTSMKVSATVSEEETAENWRAFGAGTLSVLAWIGKALLWIGGAIVAFYGFIFSCMCSSCGICDC